MKAIILQGLPGSGKTTWAEKRFEGAEEGDLRICSTDDFHTTDGVYNYDVSKVEEGHLSTWNKWVMNCYLKTPVIVLSNTNTQLWEMAPYVMAAKAAGYEVEFHTFECTVANSMRWNVHTVPDNVIRQMAKRMEKPLPFWGKHIIHKDERGEYENGDEAAQANTSNRV